MSDNNDASTQQPSLVGGLWWRARAYEIHNGLIRPASGTPIEDYDPWAAFSGARSGWGGGGAPPPYVALLELVWRIRLLPPRPQENPRLTPESAALIINWCAAHGLLGILLQETEAVYHAARWGNAVTDEERRREGVLQPIRTTYTWFGSPWDIGGWAQREEPWAVPADPLHRAPFDNEDEIYEGNLVSPELVSERWRPEVLVRPPADGAFAIRPLGPTWGPFFPSVPPAERSAHSYPWPGSERWWAEYAEPVDRFLEAAGLLFDALTRLEPGLDPSEAWGVQHFGLPTRGRKLLDSLLYGVRPIVYRHANGDWTGGWRARSLLASYAMMAYLDLVGGKRILACDVCSKPYVSGAYQARYCSDRCRNTALKRMYRSRKHQRDTG